MPIDVAWLAVGPAHLMEFVTDFDWSWLYKLGGLIERFQVLALAVALYAVRPAQQQLSLMRSQIAEAKRERLFRRYRMIKQVLRLLDLHDQLWHGIPRLAPPGFNQVADHVAYANEMRAELRKRADAVAALERAVNELQLGPEDMAIVEAGFRDAQNAIEAQRRALDEAAAPAQGTVDPHRIWLHAVDAADEAIVFAIGPMRLNLLSAQDRVVKDLAQS